MTRLSRVLGDFLVTSGVVLASAAFVGAASLRTTAPAAANRGLGSLFERRAEATAAPLVVPALPSKPANGRTGPVTHATTRPFAARAAANLQSQRPDAAAILRAETQRVEARLRVFRTMPPAQRASFARLDGAGSDAYLALSQRSPDLQVVWDGSTVVFVTGSALAVAPAGKTGRAAVESAADAFWTAAGPVFGIVDPAAELRLVGVATDRLGQSHLRYQQTYRGVEVWGRDAIVHVDREERVTCVNGRLLPTPTALGDARAILSSADAARIAAADVASRATVQTEARDMMVCTRADGTPVLAHRVRVAAALDRIFDVFVDASNGAVVHRTSLVATDGPVSGSGVDLLGATRNLDLYQVGTTFYNINASKPMFNATGSSIPQTVKGGIRIFDAQHGQGQDLFFSAAANANSWTGKAADVSAAANASVVYDYYNTRLGRNSINGQAGTMELVVNFQNNFNNAFWNGQFMIFGSGDGTAFSDLAAALDVTAHEMTHGVVENTANLVYETQSGALNESFADVFGACAEWFARPGTANWLLGEEVTTPSTPGDALRNMQDPGAANVAFGGQQPTRMSQFQNLPNDDAHDHGGVHVNSGIPNRAFYLIATNPALGATDTDRITKAEQIYYRALANYLTRTSQFIDCRLAVIRAAGDLFGGPSGAVAQACASAFDMVEITDGAPTGPPPVLPPVEGTEYLGVTDASNGRLLRVTLDFSEALPISSVGIVNKASYTDNGQFALFIDVDHKLRVTRTDGIGEQFLSTQPVWRSIAVSPDGNTLAATSTALDDSIYVVDLSGGGNDRAFAIKTVNYGGDGDDAAQYADFLDFSNDGQFVLYDVLNRKQSTSGTLEYWDVNLMRASDGAVLRVFPPQPDGIDIGNPAFSPLSDYVMTFDYVDEAGNVSVLATDLENGAVGLVTNNFASPGRPSFSPDARHIVYHYIDNNGAQLFLVSLLADGITGAGDDQSVASGGFDPVWYAVGARSAVVLSALSASQHGDRGHLTWEARADAAHDHFVLLRDSGAGYEARSGALREPVAHGVGADRWEFDDDLGDIAAHTTAVRYAVQAVDRQGQVRIAGTIEMPVDAAAAPHTVQLAGNAPNPFNPSTTIRFTVGRRQTVRLEVYDAAGARIRTLLSGTTDAGVHVRTWDGRDAAGVSMASGIYVARLAAEDGIRTHKMTLLK